ncbi:MAG: metallophosphoesterase, partial [Mariprofundaceae bacterium]|nr:metallophosphoesterase [Mariprofundaceae bacterium]
FDLPVIYVCGNHEYHDAASTMAEHIEMMKQVASGSNVTVLDNESLELYGVKFIGTTMWTDLQEAYSPLYCDIDRISVDESAYGPVHFNKDYAQMLFDKNRSWLKSALGQPFDGKRVVITHHAPSLKSLHDQYVGNPWNPCFMTNMEDLMGDRVDLWIHGHTHNNFDYEVNSTRVICNPRGYPHPFGGWENREFDESLVIDV